MASKIIRIKITNKTVDTNAIGIVELSIIMMHATKNAVMGLMHLSK